MRITKEKRQTISLKLGNESNFRHMFNKPSTLKVGTTYIPANNTLLSAFNTCDWFMDCLKFSVYFLGIGGLQTFILFCFSNFLKEQNLKGESSGVKYDKWCYIGKNYFFLFWYFYACRFVTLSFQFQNVVLYIY